MLFVCRSLLGSSKKGLQRKTGQLHKEKRNLFFVICPFFLSVLPWQRPLVPVAVGSGFHFFSLTPGISLIAVPQRCQQSGPGPGLQARSPVPQVPLLCPGAPHGRQPPSSKVWVSALWVPSPKLPKADSYLLPLFFLSIAFPPLIPPKLV